jgi:hypothetical protein
VENHQDKTHTRHGRYIARVVTLNMILLIVGIAYSNISRYRQVKAIQDAATIAKAKSEALEEQLLDYMERTVRRWDALQEFNKNLIVPRTVEPQPPGKRNLTLEELQRPRTLTPTPTPRPKIRTIIKYKPRPKPTPWRLFNW